MDRRSALTFGAAATASLAVMQAGAAMAQVPAGRTAPDQGRGSAARANSAAVASHTDSLRSRRTSFIERTDGTALFYRDWGTGRPVLFVHGAGINSDCWMYQMAAFVNAGYRCIAFDRRGHGRSSDPGRGYDFDTLADDIAAIIETLDLQRVTLIGHSMGCGEIARYLTRHGTRRVARVAMVAPTLPFLLKTEDNPAGVDKAYFQALRAEWMRDYPQWLAENAPPFFAPTTSPHTVRWGAELGLKTSLQAALECSVALTETDFREELKRITVPTLILHGTTDVSCPLAITGKPTASLIPGCELKVYEGAPHGIFITHLERVNADLLQFMA